MKSWYATTEVSALMGVSNRTIQLRAKSESWKSRPREGRGGGLEYHLESLPAEIRTSVMPISAEGQYDGMKFRLQAETEQQLQRPRLDHNFTIRDEAQFSLYQAWLAFQRNSGLSVVESQYRFAELYNAATIEVPAEIRNIYPTISRGSIARWRSEVRNKRALKTNYGNRKGQSFIDTQDELRNYLQSVIVTYPHISAKTLGEGMRTRFHGRTDLKLPGQRAIDRWLINWKKQNEQVFVAIANPDKWKNNFKVAHGSVSENVVRLNQEWEFDSTPADVMLTDGRHAITGVIDVYSRRLKLLVTPTSKAVAVAALIRRALLDWGVPEVARIDNGKEYVGHHTTRVLTSLQIEVDLTPPFSPWCKPHIERAFRTFSHGLVELLPGYIGHNVADRKELEARKSFADRLFKKNELIDLKMSATDLQQFCDRWCDLYHKREHGGLNGSTPMSMAASWMGEVRRITDQRALDLLLAEAPDNHGRRSVQKKGIRIKWPHESEHHWYIAPELGAHVSQQVTVLYDPAGDMGRVFVFGMDGFICVAECPELAGIDRKEYAEAGSRLQRQLVQEQRRELKQAAKAAGVDNLAEQILAHNEKQLGNVTMFKRPGNEHQTDFLTEAADAVRAVDELDTARPERPVTEAAITRLRAQLEMEHVREETAEDRFNRALELLDGHIPATQNDIDWLESYRTSSEFRGRYRAWRQLGAGADRNDLIDDPWIHEPLKRVG